FVAKGHGDRATDGAEQRRYHLRAAAMDDGETARRAVALAPKLAGDAIGLCGEFAVAHVPPVPRGDRRGARRHRRSIADHAADRLLRGQRRTLDALPRVVHEASIRCGATETRIARASR